MKTEQQKTEKDMLARAREYEEKKAAQSNQELRPVFHVTPPVGWMNDPNGFSLYKGEYHLFYQYHPYSKRWGPMHWGHCRTKDFIHWEQLPCALAPDMDYDGQGCFSGSAAEADGKHILMYTSVREQKLEDGTMLIRQTQSIAEGDGINYTKSAHNPVINADMLPEGSSPVDFRDPKIWKEKDAFYCVAGSRNADGSGQTALFSSDDALEWSFEGMIARSQNRYGRMWECPDFFPLDGKQVLIVSPQQMRAEGLEFHNGNNSIYFAGEYSGESKEFTAKEARQIDYGLDFYAPQTVETTDKRRVMIGWLQSWDNYLTPEETEWSGVMSVPRELSMREGKLFQLPVRELEQYRSEEILHPNVHLEKSDGEISLNGIKGRVFDMTVELQDTGFSSFEIILAADGINKTALIYDRRKGTLTTDRTYSGLTQDVICTRSMYVTPCNEKLTFRILMDKFTLEVFVNDGEQAMSSLIYTNLSAEDVRFSCDGTADFSVKKYTISTHLTAGPQN